VEIANIDENSIVFVDINNDNVDVLRVGDFYKLFQPLMQDTKDIK